MKIKISADSTIDLPKELIQKHDIAISPLTISLNNKNYRDTIDIEVDDIYQAVDAGSEVPKTSAVNVYEYIQLFEQFKDCDKVIHFSLGSLFSSSHQNALLAASEFENVEVIDTENLSAGSGLLVLKAVELREKGQSADEIVTEIRSLLPKVKVSFMVDTLEYMRKGGRIGSLTQQSVESMKIHPVISVVNGKMKIGKLIHGSLKRSLLKYCVAILENKEKFSSDRVIIAHSGLDQLLLEEVINKVKVANYFNEIIVTRAGSTISTHSGPNTLGILGILK